MILTAASTMNSFSIFPGLYVTTSSLRSGHPHLPSFCHALFSWLFEKKRGIMGNDGFCSTKQGPQPSRIHSSGKCLPSPLGKELFKCQFPKIMTSVQTFQGINPSFLFKLPKPMGHAQLLHTVTVTTSK